MRYVKLVSLYQMDMPRQERTINEIFEKINRIGYVEKTQYVVSDVGNLKEVIIEYEGSEKI